MEKEANPSNQTLQNYKPFRDRISLKYLTKQIKERVAAIKADSENETSSVKQTLEKTEQINPEQKSRKS